MIPTTGLGLLATAGFSSVILLILLSLSRSTWAAPDPNAVKVQGPDTIGNALPINVLTNTGGQTPVTLATWVGGSSTSTTGAALTVTLPAAAGKITYITGYRLSSTNGSTTANGTLTISGLAGGTTLTGFFWAGTASIIQDEVCNFALPIPANAANTTIVVTTSSLTTPAPNISLAVYGFQM